MDIVIDDCSDSRNIEREPLVLAYQLDKGFARLVAASSFIEYVGILPRQHNQAQLGLLNELNNFVGDHG